MAAKDAIKLRGVITITLSVKGFKEASQVEARLEEILAGLITEFQCSGTVEVAERRESPLYHRKKKDQDAPMEAVAPFKAEPAEPITEEKTPWSPEDIAEEETPWSSEDIAEHPQEEKPKARRKNSTRKPNRRKTRGRSEERQAAI